MSLLNEIKKEAETVKLQQAKRHLTDQERADALRQALGPKMRAQYTYLKELFENLKVVDPDIRRDYEVKLHGRLDGLRQGEYRVTAPDTRVLDCFSLHFTCQSEGAIRKPVRGTAACEKHREYLWSHNLRFTSKILADGTGVFTLDRFVPVTVEFRANLERGGVELTVKNLDLLGTNRVFLTLEQLTDELMEELGKCVLRKENRFNELCGNTLSREMREQLRRRLTSDDVARERAEESAGAAKGGKRKGLFRFVRKSAG